MKTLKEFIESLPEKVLQTGVSPVEQPEIHLQAGKLTMIYSKGALRYISAGNNELIRMIYAAVRDRNWLTINPVIQNEKLEINENSFIIEVKCLYQTEDIAFSADYRIEGKENNCVILSMEGLVLEQTKKNRIGFCVLHPIEGIAGNNCIILHNDGSSEQSVFPDEISPHIVFKDIKALSWILRKAHCRIEFEGDVFETEDQRNWTDASFKTYSTPLSLPYPVVLEKGTGISQKVTFSFEGPDSLFLNQKEKTVVRLFPEEALRLPSIGICQSSRSSPLTQSEIKILRSLRFDHYRIDLHLYKSGWQFIAEQGYREATDLGYQMEIALFFDDNVLQQVNNFKDWYSRRRLPVSSILIFHKSYPSTPDLLAKEIIPHLKERNPGVRIATGTNGNFAQLNRNTPGDTGNDYLCYSIHPQEHASDNSTLVENLEAQGYSVHSALRLPGDKKTIVSPVTIQRRFNANVSFVEDTNAGNQAPSSVDSRLMSLFGACWTAGSLKFICEGGVESVTYHEIVGERGIFQGEMDSKWPDHFPAMKGMIFPVFHLFRFFLANKDLKLIKSRSSSPLEVDCLALSDGKQVRIILVNYTAKVHSLRFDCCSGLFRLRKLDSGSYSEAAANHRWTGIEKEKVIKSESTFDLDPFSVNFIEGWRKH